MSFKKHFLTAALLIGVFCGVFIVSFIIMNLTIKPQIAEAPVTSQNDAVTAVADSNVITKHTIVKQEIYYTKCRHLETQELQDDVDYVGKTFADLEAAGWQVYEAEKGAVVISKDVDGFCPNDDKKRHISKCGEYIAIYKGPLNLGGDLIEKLPIKISSLPQDWQTQILNGGYEFADENALNDALESLDEYNEQ